MRLTRLAAPLALLLLAPLPALAQSAAAGDTQLRTTITRRQPIVHPPIPPEAIAQDTEQAVQAVRERRARELARDEAQPPRRPLNRDYDVTSGIQAQNIQRALRR